MDLSDMTILFTFSYCCEKKQNFRSTFLNVSPRSILFLWVFIYNSLIFRLKIFNARRPIPLCPHFFMGRTKVLRPHPQICLSCLPLLSVLCGVSGVGLNGANMLVSRPYLVYLWIVRQYNSFISQECDILKFT